MNGLTTPPPRRPSIFFGGEGEITRSNTNYTTTNSKYYGDNREYTTKEVNSGSFFRSYTPVEQNYKPNQKLTEDDILETYIISNYV